VEFVTRQLSPPILFVLLLSIANATNRDVKEIRFKSIGGYSDPRFILSVHSDGTVEYTGINHVTAEAKRISRVSPTEFKRLTKKIERIRFFQLEDRYARYPLDRPVTVRGTEATAESTFVTDQPTEIVTVVTNKGMKSVEDYMGEPKGLHELEQLILDLTHAPRWSGDVYDRDVPYYDKFPLNTRVTYRALLEHYHAGGDRRRISGYVLMFINNKAIRFDVESQPSIDLQKFDGYLVDASGQIRQKPKMGYKFILTDIRPVRRYLSEKALNY
jgi:hypothetical protein